MFAIMKHEVIPPLTLLWYKGLGFSILAVIVLIFILKNRKKHEQDLFLRLMSVFFFTAWIYAIIYEINNGIWTIEDSLPLHLCRVSFIICIIASWRPKQWMFEWCLYLAIPAGLHAILTPELTMGRSNWLLFHYYLTHAAMLFVPLYLSFVKKMKARRNSWWKIVLYLQILVIINFPLNFLVDANYMYLHHKPLADNPFLIGEWPWYIIILEAVMILHVVIIRLIFKTTSK